MVIDANFILTIAKLVVELGELGEKIMIPVIQAFHHDKTSDQRDAAIKAVTDTIQASKGCIILPLPHDNKI